MGLRAPDDPASPDEPCGLDPVRPPDTVPVVSAFDRCRLVEPLDVVVEFWRLVETFTSFVCRTLRRGSTETPSDCWTEVRRRVTDTLGSSVSIRRTVRRRTLACST